jgi:hypothetical protein
MKQELDTTPYEPRPEVGLPLIENARRLFLHYGQKKLPFPINFMNNNSTGDLRNINPFILCWMQSPREKLRGRKIHYSTPILDKLGYKIPKLSDQARKLKYFPQIRGYTIDFGLVLRGIGEPNKAIAEDLTDQIQARYGRVEFPLLISLRGAFLKYLPGSGYGAYAFKITNETQIVHAPMLNQPGFFLPENLDEQTCLPKAIRQERDSSSLELITQHPITNQPVTSGVTRAYLNIWNDIDCGNNDLARVDLSSRLYLVKE